MNSMNCEEMRPLLTAYVDGELDFSAALALERHLETCTTCSGVLEAQRATSQLIRSAPYHRAPDSLRMRLQSAHLPPPSRAATARRRDPMRWALPIAASLALALMVDLGLAQQRAGDALTNELVSGHIRALQAAHLSDVISTDQHTVKPWFEGRLDFAPPVRDLAGQGFPLTGGRLDYIQHRAVAALIYMRGKHPIDLFVWPSGSGIDTAARTRAGFNLVHWNAEGMSFWAVSDLNRKELEEFSADLQRALSPVS